jgi:hypothetical protein
MKNPGQFSVKINRISYKIIFQALFVEFIEFFVDVHSWNKVVQAGKCPLSENAFLRFYVLSEA